MRYRPFVKTGLYVSELCLGTMTFGGKGFWEVIGRLTASEAEALPPEYPGWMVERQNRDRQPATTAGNTKAGNVKETSE